MGCLVGLAELLTSFEAPFGTPRNKWPWILMVVNGLTGMGVFWLLVQVRGMPERPILTAVAVGLGFHALIRTKLVLAKSFFPRSSPDWGLDVGWLYTRLQDFVKKRLDQALMRGRKQSIDRLTRFYTLDGLYTEVKTAIQLRETFSEEEKEAERRKVDEFMNDQSLSNDLLKIYLAEKLISVAGQDYVDLLLRKRTQVAERPGEEVLEEARALLGEGKLEEKARTYLEHLLGDPSLDEETRLRTVKAFLNIWRGR